MAEPDRTTGDQEPIQVHPPSEWVEGRLPLGVQQPLMWRHAETGFVVAAISMVLSDDSVLVALYCDRGGRRFARMSPDTNWAIEERYESEPPGAVREGFEDAWRMVVESMVHANRRASRAEETT